MGDLPDDVLAALLRLEAKQVLRGFKSGLFPDMTLKEAQAIRQLPLEVLTEELKRTKRNEVPQ